MRRSSQGVRLTQTMASSTLAMVVFLLLLCQTTGLAYDTGVDDKGFVSRVPAHQYLTREAIKVWNDAPLAAQKEFVEHSKRDIKDPIDQVSRVDYDAKDDWLGILKADDLISGSAEEDQIKAPTQVFEDCNLNRDALNGYFEHFWDPDIPWEEGFNCGKLGGGYNFGLPVLSQAFLDKYSVQNSRSYSVRYLDTSDRGDSFVPGQNADSTPAVSRGEDFRTYDSAYRLAQYYWDQKAVPAYRSGDKRQAYYWLGRIAHLLQDMTVPTHVHTRYHDPFVNQGLDLSFMGTDLFENYASSNIENYGAGERCAGKYYKQENPIPNFQWSVVHGQPDPPGLFKLFWYTAQKTQYFASASSDGRSAINWVNGNSYCRTWDRTRGKTPQPFNPSLWDNEDLCGRQYRIEIIDDPNQVQENLYNLANPLIPHALKATAALYRLFWYTVSTSPQVDAIPTDLIVSSSLRILESPPYKVGQEITATYSLKNPISSSVPLEIITVGGRLDGMCPDNKCPDFTFETNKILTPSKPYEYRGTRTLDKPGKYHFFAAYKKAGKWNTSIPTDPGVANTKDIVVKELPTEETHAEMVLIPAGEFLTWNPGDDYDRPPQVRVYLDAFHIDKYEVTNSQYKAFLDATGYDGRKDADKNYLKQWVGGTYPTGEWNHPVVWVSDRNAEAYAKWAGKRLPTEVEWEKACRAGSDKRYCFGDDGKRLGEYAWYRDNSGWRTHPVGQKKPNSWGLYDMHGNVWERCVGVKQFYGRSPINNPEGLTNWNSQVIRGGSFIHYEKFLKRIDRFCLIPVTETRSDVGFRCAR